nr:MAG TPA: hypothetical protein [Bacteriophage sp.]
MGVENGVKFVIGQALVVQTVCAIFHKMHRAVFVKAEPFLRFGDNFFRQPR